MDWKLFPIAVCIMAVAALLAILYGAVKMWKSNNKFISFIYLLIAVSIGIGIYFLIGPLTK